MKVNELTYNGNNILELYQNSCNFEKKCELVVVQRTYPSGVRHLVTQCKTCGNSMGGFVSRKNLDPSVEIKPFNEKLHSDVYLKKLDELLGPSPEQIAVMKKLHEIKKKIKAKFYKDLLNVDGITFDDVYEPYMNSKYWQEKRKKILERDNYTCRYCETNKAEAVHHMSYQNLGNEPDFELLSVCRKCHEEIHNIRIEPSPDFVERQELELAQQKLF